MRVLFTAFLVLVSLPAYVGPAYAVDVQEVVSPGGIKAWLVEDSSIPVVSVRFAFKGGAAADPIGKEGLASFASSTMDEGAESLDSQAFQGKLEDMSITLRFSAGTDTFGGQIKTLSGNADHAFALLGIALSNPRFDEEPVERIRRQIQAGLRSQANAPNTVASKAFFKAMFPGHAYSRPTKGTEGSIAAITRDDLKTFASRLGRDTLQIGVAGDMDPERLGRLLDRTFGRLPAHAQNATVATAQVADQAAVIVEQTPAQQSAILFGQPGIMRDDADFYVAYVMNHILGAGGFTSRLYTQVRENRGLAYSVGSYLYPFDHAAIFYGQAGTANKRVGETLAVIREEWAKARDGGFSQAELDDAKTYMTGSFPLRFTNTGAIAAMLLSMQQDDLGMDYIDVRNSYINAVTLADVNRVAHDLLKPEQLIFVVAGEPHDL